MNISNKELNKEITKFLKSKSKKEWFKALLEEERLFSTTKIKELQQENSALQSKLDNQKYLDYKEVEKVIEESKTVEYDGDGSAYDYFDSEKAITAICSLSIKPITKEHIIDVLEKKFKERSYGEGYDFIKDCLNVKDQIATEILGDEKNETI